MPKKSVRKKKQKVKDFNKVKLRLGKKLKADNHTNVSFKAKAVIVPGQSILTEKAGQSTNKRNLTLNELITQMKHYSPSVRKDALTGLCQLLDMHPHIIHVYLGLVMTSLLRLIVDEDNDVRKMLVITFEQILPKLTKEQLSPFIATYVVYVCSGLTHIFEDVRFHALRCLDLWTQNVAQLFVPHAGTILPHYVRLMGGAEITGSIFGKSALEQATRTAVNMTCNIHGYVTSLKHRTQVLQSLANFLEYIAPINEISKDTMNHLWPLSQPTFSLFTGTRMTANRTSSMNNSTTFSTSSPLHMFRLIQSVSAVLTAFWLEAAPCVFTSTKITFGQPLDTCRYVVRIICALWKGISSDISSTVLTCADDWRWFTMYMRSIERHYLLYFPFGHNVHGQHDKKTEYALIDLNAEFAETLANIMRVQLIATTSSALTRMITKDASLSKSISSWENQLYNYLVSLFSSQRNALSDSQCFVKLLSALTTCLQQSYTTSSTPSLSLESTSVNTTDNDNNNNSSSNEVSTERNKHVIQLLTSIVGWYRTLPSSHKIKQVVVDFLMDLIQAPIICDRLSGQINVLTLVRDHASSYDLYMDLEQFTKSLARYLWELKSTAPELSARILCFHRRMLQCNDTLGSVFRWSEHVLIGYQKGIAAFLYADTRKGPLYGPFLQSSTTVQLLAIDTMYYMKQLSDTTVNALLKCCLGPIAICPVVISRTILVMQHCTPLATYISFLLTLIVGMTQDGLASLVPRYQTDTSIVNIVFTNDTVVQENDSQRKLRSNASSSESSTSLGDRQTVVSLAIVALQRELNEPHMLLDIALPLFTKLLDSKWLTANVVQSVSQFAAQVLHTTLLSSSETEAVTALQLLCNARLTTHV